MENQNFAKAEMLIRQPVDRVFEAFVDPAITTKFWFTKSTGKLEEHKKVDWSWEMYGFTATVLVKKIERNKKIVIEWGDDDTKSTVEWSFQPFSAHTTWVSIINKGFEGTSEQMLSQVRDSTEGFSLVLAGLKAYLEHHIQLNLVADRFPKELNA